MVSTAREVPQEVWEQHKETILSLRFGEKLPLDDATTNDRNIIQIMRDEHQFHATVSQYEAQLKKWAACKNLKKREWETILPVYDELKERGFEPRVRLGDQVLDERRVKRARRYARGKAVDRENTATAASLTRSRIWRLEVRQPDGQYMEYSGTHGELNIADVQPSMTPIPWNARSGSSDVTSRPLPVDPIWLPDSPYMANMSSSQLDNFHPALPSPQRNLENIDEFFSSFISHDMSTSVPFLSCDELDIANPMGNAIYSPIRYRSRSPLGPQWALSNDRIESMLWDISHEPRLKWKIDPKCLNSQIILDKLESLFHDDLLDEGLGNGFGLMSRGTISMSEIHRRIVFSIINNFAGFQDISPAVLLSMLRMDREISSCLFDGLRSDDLTIAKPLADNLFRAAIEAGDEEAVGIILETTSGRMNEIDLNHIVCQFKERSYTPLALASYLNYSGIVQKLLSFGAQVSVASSKPKYLFTGCALAAIVSRRRLNERKIQHTVQDHQETVRILELLLDHGAEIKLSLLSDVIHTTGPSSELVKMLIQAVPRERHPELFESDDISRGLGAQSRRSGSILYCVAAVLEDKLSDELIRNIITTCQTMNCIPACTVKYSQALSRILLQVILKGNLGLMEYLMEYTRPTTVHLAAAMHSGRLELIELMLNKGICAQGKVICLKCKGYSAYLDGCTASPCGILCHTSWNIPDERSHKLTTPLAEAIRLQNYDLTRRLEHCGALHGISEGPLEFRAAVLATAEVGNLPYLKQLLNLAPIGDQQGLLDPILKAIAMGHGEIAITLIIHYARINIFGFRGCNKSHGDLLLMALKKRNREIVDTLLEYFEFFCSSLTCRHSYVVEEAVRWGEKSIVEELLQLGLLASSIAVKHDIRREQRCIKLKGGALLPSASALEVAIKTRNTELVALLLEWGANPSELGVVIEIGDEGMMRLLLEHGADPADDKAFYAVSKSDNRLLPRILFEAFSSRYPDGKKGFGGVALSQAIESRNVSFLDVLLKLKLDVNSFWNWAYTDEEGIVHNNGGLLRFALYKSRERDVEMVMNQMIRQLLDAGADPEAAAIGKTALLEAICVNNIEAVKLLLSSGADINRPARRGLKRTPLQQACQQGSFQMVEFLLDNGADVRAPPAVNGGATALQLAAIQGSARIVRLLLDKGADIHAAPAVCHGRTALEGGAEHGRVSVLNILLAEGAAGYSVEEIKSAKAYAEKGHHRGCEERLKLALFRFGEVGGLKASLCL